MNHHPNVEKTMMNERLLFPSEPSVYHLEDVTVIRLEGPDAVKYLNGQVTCDVAALIFSIASLPTEAYIAKLIAPFGTIHADELLSPFSEICFSVLLI